MNKLLVSGIINLNKGSYILEFNNNEATINVLDEVTVYILNSNIKKLTINLEDNSKLNIYKYDKLLKNDIDIIINENNDTFVNFNGTFISERNVLFKLSNYIKGNNNSSNINIRSVSNNDSIKIIVDVDIEKDTFNNTALEDLKGLNNGGFIHIEPNIMCKSNEVVANHLTTIGTFDQDNLSYLMSKGLSELNAKELLLNGFIYSNMDKCMKDLLGGD